MSKQYSIAEARDRFAAIVRELDRDELVQVTRRGKTVAIMLSIEEYERLKERRRSFWDNYLALCKETNLVDLAIEPDIFASVRDRAAGREMDW